MPKAYKQFVGKSQPGLEKTKYLFVTALLLTNIMVTIIQAIIIWAQSSSLSEQILKQNNY